MSVPSPSSSSKSPPMARTPRTLHSAPLGTAERGRVMDQGLGQGPRGGARVKGGVSASGGGQKGQGECECEGQGDRGEGLCGASGLGMLRHWQVGAPPEAEILQVLGAGRP